MLRTKKLKTEEAPAATPEPSLADRLKEACAAAEAFIETIAQKEKAEAPTIPIDWHRLNLKLMYGSCACKCALALLEKEAKWPMTTTTRKFPPRLFGVS
jgi:hypothetical protein